MNPTEAQQLRQEIVRLKQAIAIRPVRVPTRGGSAPATVTRRLVIDVGNGTLIGNSLEGVLYSPTLTPTAVYDPNVDTVYPAGLCCGFLYENGEQKPGKVLIRHNYTNYPIPILQGTVVDSPGTTTFSYDPGSGPVTMTAYLLDFL